MTSNVHVCRPPWWGKREKGERRHDKRRKVKRTDSGREGRGKRRDSNEERKKELEACFSYSVSGEMGGTRQERMGTNTQRTSSRVPWCFVRLMYNEHVHGAGHTKMPGDRLVPLSFFCSFLAISRCVEKRRCVVLCACVQERQQARHGPKRYLRRIRLPHMLHNNQPYTRMNSKAEPIEL